ncbi:hypothetical protein JNB63_20620 [Microbacterium trichothecenolyticum]|uniref:hypothetical protein n=1 Tax=Microbacterium trichothecenolyticum TaxID=69370 RepID=UPI001C6EF07C|nr:hypothetical protein [Microbacterium trichothecenolyticum]MBW9122499.1 hypothetical protein [Microbacterium trichothecenolyticum]
MTSPPLGHVLAASPVELLRARDSAFGGADIRDRKRYVRVRAGVYAFRDAWNGLAPWERYLARVHACAMKSPRAVFAYESAAVLLGLPIFGEPRDIHVFSAERRASRRFSDVCVHTSADAKEVIDVGGLRVTSVVATAVDLMRVLPPLYGLAVGDAAVSPRQGGTTDADELGTLAGSQRIRRGIARLRLLLSVVDARAESPGESVSRGVILWAGFETPELQLVFRSEGYKDRVDFAWRSVRAIGESDGYGKYVAETPEETVRRVIDEKKREERLRRQCAAFDRWDMKTAEAVGPLVERLEGLGVPRVGPPIPVLLSAKNPRSFSPVPRITSGKPRSR